MIFYLRTEYTLGEVALSAIGCVLSQHSLVRYAVCRRGDSNMQSDIERQIFQTFEGDEADIIIEAVREELSNPENSSIQIFLGAIILAAIGLYKTEKSSDSAINTFGDALWSAFNAVTNVGESGCPPTTPWGRLISASLVLFGTPVYERVNARIAHLVNRLTSGSAADTPGAKAPAVAAALEASDYIGAGPAFRDALVDLGTGLTKTQGRIAKIEAATAANRRTLSKLSEHEVVTDELLEKMNALLAVMNNLKVHAAPAPAPTLAAKPAPPASTAPPPPAPTAPPPELTQPAAATKASPPKTPPAPAPPAPAPAAPAPAAAQKEPAPSLPRVETLAKPRISLPSVSDVEQSTDESHTKVLQWIAQKKKRSKKSKKRKKKK